MDSSSYGLNKQELGLIFNLIKEDERELDDITIDDWFGVSPHFYTTPFWYIYEGTFAFQPWSSVMEFRRYACKQPGTSGCDCVIRDDLKPYWAQLHEADALVLGAPIYAGSICGPMISYMNRHYCLLDKAWTVRVKPGIRVIGVFTQGQSDPNAYLDRIDWFLSDFERRNMIVRDKIVKTGREPVKNDTALMRRAYEDGLHLAD